MSHRYTDRARRLGKLRRIALKMLMGGRCCKCGEKRFSRLQFHHTGKRIWWTNGRNSRDIAKRYVQDWLDGILKLYCTECHKTAPIPQEDEIPF